MRTLGVSGVRVFGMLLMPTKSEWDTLERRVALQLFPIQKIQKESPSWKVF